MRRPALRREGRTRFWSGLERWYLFHIAQVAGHSDPPRPQGVSVRTVRATRPAAHERRPSLIRRSPFVLSGVRPALLHPGEPSCGCAPPAVSMWPSLRVRVGCAETAIGIVASIGVAFLAPGKPPLKRDVRAIDTVSFDTPCLRSAGADP